MSDDSFNHPLTCSRWFQYDENHKRYVPDAICDCEQVKAQSSVSSVAIESLNSSELESLSNQELSARVALGIMGWVVETDAREVTRLMKYCQPDERGSVIWYKRPEGGWSAATPAFATDIASAFLVIGKMRESDYAVGLCNDIGYWDVDFSNGPEVKSPYKSFCGTDELLPRAICIAALRTVQATAPSASDAPLPITDGGTVLPSHPVYECRLHGRVEAWHRCRDFHIL